jgi:tRNA A-37 threonylcarbamoyl transferase component Bud32
MREIKDSPRSCVRIGYDGRVHKTFRGKGAKQRFHNEVRILRLLEERGCDYVPRLLEAHPDELYIVTTNCGQMARHMRKKKMDSLFDQLERDYGVRHDDPFEKNLTYRKTDGRFCIIDFELAEALDNWEKREETEPS